MRGFSLVELSIVLVILGLLTGGILAGQSLIHAAELRAVTTEYQRWYTASRAFRDKYFAIPGDFNNAQAFWGQSTNCGGGAATGTCNGNGDGYVQDATTAGGTGEAYQHWTQLALAGLIEGSYTGLSGASGTYVDLVGTATPRSKYNGGGWGTHSAIGMFAGNGSYYSYNMGNYYVFGGSSTTGSADQALLKPEDAWNIDTKMDDGKPGTGGIIPRDAVGFGNTGSCTTSASKTDYTGSYNLSVTSAACALIFVRAY